MNEECKWICDENVKKLFNDLYFPSNNDKIKNINKYHENCKIKNNKFSILDVEKDEPEIIRTKKYKLDINSDQKLIILEWMLHCRNVYNKCVEKKANTFNYMKLKLDIFNELYGKEKKDCPYDILTDEVKSYCSNLKSAVSNKKAGNIKFFELKPRKLIKCQSILIPKKSIKETGFFRTKLGDIENFEKKIDFKNVKCDCRLLYDKILDKFYLYVPEHKKIKYCNNNKKDVVAVDPGEKTFISYYSLNNYGKIGDDIKNPILNIEKKIRKYQRILSGKKNKNNEKLKNKKIIRIRKYKCYRKINNIVKELHNKASLYLCRNYKRILLPEFRTQQMVKNDKKEMKIRIKQNIIRIKNDRLEARKYQKKCRLSGRVKFVLNMLSFYKFKQQLLNKSQEYGCKVEIVTEEYTSQCCGKCGKLSNQYNKREKECVFCNAKINRDVNGARNILIKNYNKWLRIN